MSTAVEAFKEAALVAKMAAYGDSNDHEISALQEALSHACLALNVDEIALNERAQELADAAPA